MSEKRIQIAPSILSADFSNVRAAVAEVEASGAQILHLDVMDGVFVPEITFGPKLVRDIRPHSDLVFDAHLMITSPESQVDAFIDAGCDYVTIHQESCIHLNRVLNRIKEKGAKCGISIVPSTPVSAITPLLDLVDLVLVMTVNPGWGGQRFIPQAAEKIEELDSRRRESGFGYLIEADGGIGRKNIGELYSMGMDLAVMGSAFFAEDDKASFLRSIEEGL